MKKSSYILFSILSFSFFLVSFLSSPSDFTNWDLGYILILFTICLSIQISVLQYIKKKRSASRIIRSIFLLINLIALYLSLSSDFLSLPTWQHILFFSAFIWIFYTLFSIIESNPIFEKLAVFATISAILLLILPIFLISPPKMGNISQEKEVFFNYTFNESPNIYMLSFDSLITKNIALKHLNIEKQEYHNILDEFMIPFRNFFSVGSVTRTSLNGHLAFRRKYYRSLQYEENNLKIYSGREPSPLLEIFHLNGYESTTFYESSYFGKFKGPHIDRYEINKHLTACDFVGGIYRRLVFFGICQQKPQFLGEYIVRNLLNEKKRSDIEFVIDTIERATKLEKPQIVFGYIYSPGHTPLDFSYDNPDKLDAYKRYFESNSNKTARILRQVIEFLQVNDPTGVLLVFGDHGPWLSRGVQWENDLDFRFPDTYAVYGGIYPKTFCPERLLDRSDVPFTTSVSAAEEIILCLSGFNGVTRAHTSSVPFDAEPPLEGKQYEAHLYQ